MACCNLHHLLLTDALQVQQTATAPSMTRQPEGMTAATQQQQNVGQTEQAATAPPVATQPRAMPAGNQQEQGAGQNEQQQLGGSTESLTWRQQRKQWQQQQELKQRQQHAEKQELRVPSAAQFCSDVYKMPALNPTPNCLA